MGPTAENPLRWRGVAGSFSRSPSSQLGTTHRRMRNEGCHRGPYQDLSLRRLGHPLTKPISKVLKNSPSPQIQTLKPPPATSPRIPLLHLPPLIPPACPPSSSHLGSFPPLASPPPRDARLAPGDAARTSQVRQPFSSVRWLTFRLAA